MSSSSYWWNTPPETGLVWWSQLACLTLWGLITRLTMMYKSYMMYNMKVILSMYMTILSPAITSIMISGIQLSAHDVQSLIPSIHTFLQWQGFKLFMLGFIRDLTVFILGLVFAIHNLCGLIWCPSIHKIHAHYWYGCEHRHRLFS